MSWWRHGVAEASGFAGRFFGTHAAQGEAFIVGNLLTLVNPPGSGRTLRLEAVSFTARQLAFDAVNNPFLFLTQLTGNPGAAGGLVAAQDPVQFPAASRVGALFTTGDAIALLGAEVQAQWLLDKTVGVAPAGEGQMLPVQNGSTPGLLMPEDTRWCLAYSTAGSFVNWEGTVNFTWSEYL